MPYYRVSKTRKYARQTSSKTARKPYARRVYGDGNYFTEKVWPKARPYLKKMGRAAVTTGLGAIPGVGGVASTIGGMLWDKLIGQGAYAPMNFQVKNNSFMKEITANGPPQMWVNNQQAFVFRHREYIQDIVSSSSAGAFKIESFSIQPGSSDTFPWLAEIAKNFQQYRIDGMLFEFVSTSGDAVASNNTALGTVIATTNYNAGDNTFASKQQMMATEFCSVGKPSCSILHPIECKPSLTSVDNLYVRGGELPPDQDIRLYDLGNFQIATQGMQAASVSLGELWCTYQITFMKPIINPDTSVLADSYLSFKSSTVNGENPFGTSLSPANGSNIDVQLDPSETEDRVTIELPSAQAGESYLMQCQWIGSSTASVQAPTLLTPQKTEVYDIYQNYSTPTAGNQSGLTTTTLNFIGAFKVVESSVPGSYAQVRIGTYQLPGSITSMTLLITRINPNLTQPAFELFDKKKELTPKEKEQQFVQEFNKLKSKYGIVYDPLGVEDSGTDDDEPEPVKPVLPRKK